MIAFKHRSPAQLGMALDRRFLFLLVSMPSYISIIEFAFESSTYRTARRPFRSNLRLAGLPSDSFGFAALRPLVPALHEGQEGVPLGVPLLWQFHRSGCSTPLDFHSSGSLTSWELVSVVNPPVKVSQNSDTPN